MIEPTGRVTQVVEPGPDITPAEIDRLLSAYESSLAGCDAVVVAGSVPPGVPGEVYRDMISLAKSRGLFTVLNAYGDAFVAGVEAAPDVAKPDIRFQPEVLGITSSVPAGRRQIAERLFELGVRVVVISIDHIDHAVYTPTVAYNLTAPRQFVGTRIVAGDAFLAGFIDAHRRGLPLAEASAWGTATEVAASQVPEKRIATPADVEHFLGMVELRRAA